jgi:uncharacterized protein YndB with AHSA1/START domain
MMQPLAGWLAVRAGFVISALAAPLWLGGRAHPEVVEPLTVGGFSFVLELTLPGDPETIYDAATGDISGWWDHSFSGKPARLDIEAKPGGGFWEIFDDSGDGVLHARVTFAQRGKLLRFEGPLGLTGHAIQMVTTYELEPKGDSTAMKVTVRAAGEMQERWPQAVEGAWRHFLFERFKPYVEAGRRRR